MDELNELKRLAGIQQNSPGTVSPLGGSNISITGTEKFETCAIQRALTTNFKLQQTAVKFSP
jgi:hypothetical protein